MSKQRVDGSVIIDVEADLSKFQTQISKIAKVGAVTLTAIVGSASLATKAIYDVGTSFESAFAGVKKTVNASAAELEGFRKEILNLSTEIPQTADGIANIAEAAGQLGIKNNALMGFTRTMADLGVATNMGATEAATTLARFANITQMSQDNFGRLGSTIVELGNNLATTEAEIADMALNIAGAGHQVGMTEPQILALSAALSSVGIEAAAGGTAMSTLMIEIKKATVLGGKDLEKFANVANMSASDFKDAFEKDAGKAIQTFIEGLGTASERGVDAIELLNDAGLTEVRMTRALLNAANASEVFSNSFDLANQAWDENIALTKEAAQRYETTESKMQILNNTIAKVGITAFEKFKEPFKDAIDTGIDSVETLTNELENGKLGDSVDNIAKSFNDLLKTTIEIGTKALPPLIDGMAWVMDNADVIIAGILGVAIATKGLLVVQQVNKSYKAFKDIMLANAKATKLTGKALDIYTAKTLIADKANKLLGVSSGGLYMILGAVAVAGLAALTVGYIKYLEKLDNANNMIKENSKKMNELKETMSELDRQSKENFKSQSLEITNAELYADKIKSLVDENGNLIGSKDELVGAIDRFNNAVGESFFYYDQETGKLMTQNGEIANVTQSIKDLIAMKYANAYVDANMDKYTEAIKAQSEITDQNRKALELYNEAREKYKGYDIDGMLKFNETLKDGKTSQEELNTALSNFGVSNTKFSEIMAEVNGPLETMLNNSKEFESLEANVIKPIEKLQEAIASNDFETMNNFKLGLDISDEANSMTDYITKISELETNLKEMDQFSELGIKFNEDEYNAIKEQIDDLKTEFGETFAVDYESLDTNAIDGAALVGGSWKDGVLTKNSEMNSDLVTGTITAANTATAGIVSAASSCQPPPVIIPVYYQIMNSIGSVAGGMTPGASYDDTQEPYRVIQPDYGRMVDMAKSVFSGVQNRVARSVTLPSQKLVLQGGSNTEINQHIEFNQPVQKPSEFTRAMNKASKELKKAK